MLCIMMGTNGKSEIVSPDREFGAVTAQTVHAHTNHMEEDAEVIPFAIAMTVTATCIISGVILLCRCVPRTVRAASTTHMFSPNLQTHAPIVIVNRPCPTNESAVVDQSLRKHDCGGYLGKIGAAIVA